MQALGRLIVIISVGFASFGFSASLTDQFEVAKTKLLFQLANSQTSAALETIEQLADVFSDSVHEQEWQYWRGVTFSRNEQLTKAQDEFQSLDRAGYKRLNFEFEFGVVLLKSKDFAAAVSEFQDWKSSHPESLQAIYYLALAYYELDEFQSASTELSTLVNPNISLELVSVSQDQAIYLYAASLANLKKYKESKNQLDRIINWPGGSVYEEAAEDLLSSIAENEQLQKTLQASVQLISAVDSNVSLLNESTGLDARGAFQLDASYRLNEWLTPSYQFFTSKHLEASEYDLMVNSFNLNSQTSLKKSILHLSYQFALNHLDGEMWLTKHRLESQLAVNNFSSGLELGVDQYQDESNYKFSISGRWKPSVASDDLTANTSILLGNQTNEQFEMEELGITAAANVTLQRQLWSYGGSAQLQYLMFAENSGKERAFNISGSILAIRQWSSVLSTRAKIDVFSSSATPENLSYQRAVGSLSVSWRF
jgi:tetratricopeptide (TPR) repeat protein